MSLHYTPEHRDGFAYALSRMRFRGRQASLNWILSQRFVPERQRLAQGRRQVWPA